MKISAQKRTKQGTGASRRLRAAGKAPGIVYGGEGQPQAIVLDHNELWHALRNEAFHSSILDLDLEGQKSQVLLRDVQVHPYRREVLHVDFLRVSEKEEITVFVPLHYSGEEESTAVKIDKCLVDRILNEIEVRCLPADLPDGIAVDLSGLEQGSTITAADLALPEGVALALRGRDAEDLVLVSVVVPRAEAAEEDLDEEETLGTATDAQASEGEGEEGGEAPEEDK